MYLMVSLVRGVHRISHTMLNMVQQSFNMELHVLKHLLCFPVFFTTTTILLFNDIIVHLNVCNDVFLVSKISFDVMFYNNKFLHLYPAILVHGLVLY